MFPLLWYAEIIAGAHTGESGTTGVDCGDHGSEHEGHGHCDSGYPFDGTTCVDPADITTECVEHDDGEEDDHAACLCPSTGTCPCDHGENEFYGGSDDCVPELHDE